MKYKLSLIILILAFNNHVQSQVDDINPLNEYDYRSYSLNDKCFAFNYKTDTTLIVRSNENSEYISLQIIKVESNLSSFIIDDNNKLYFPYEKDEYENNKVQIEYLPYDIVDQIPANAIDTIYIIRNQPYSSLIDYPKKEPKYQGIVRNQNARIWTGTKDIIAFTTINPDYYQFVETSNLLVDVEIEFRNSDIITSNGVRRIKCLKEVDKFLIKKLNQALIKRGFLLNKRRLKYKPEIRNALIDFQKKSNLELGFIDNETLKALNLKR